MRALLLIPLLWLLVGCEINQITRPAGTVSLQKQLTRELPDAIAVKKLEELLATSEPLLFEEQSSETGWRLPPISTVLLYEQLLCKQSRDVRQQQITRLQSQPVFGNRFDTLLLSSCSPDFFPSVLARTLKQLRATRDWPATYQAYFALQDRHMNALGRLENLYGNLKEKMDTTIEKLTEIEVETQP